MRHKNAVPPPTPVHILAKAEASYEAKRQSACWLKAITGPKKPTPAA